MVGIIDYTEWISSRDLSNSKKYKIIKDNNRCSVIYNIQRKIYIKIFKKPLTLEHSQFLTKLVSIPYFYRKYTRFLMDLMFTSTPDDSVLIQGYIMKGGKILNIRQLRDYLNKTKIQWLRDMEKYQFYFSDFKPANLININNQISLIDLESIRQITQTVPNPRSIKNKQAVATTAKIDLYGLDWYYSKIYNIQRNIKPIESQVTKIVDPIHTTTDVTTDVTTNVITPPEVIDDEESFVTEYIIASMQNELNSNQNSNITSKNNLPPEIPLEIVEKVEPQMNEISINEMPINEIPINEMPINETPVIEVSVMDISINETPVNEMTVNEMPVNETVNETQQLLNEIVEIIEIPMAPL